jgi:hypothetical protein
MRSRKVDKIKQEQGNKSNFSHGIQTKPRHFVNSKSTARAASVQLFRDPELVVPTGLFTRKR